MRLYPPPTQEEAEAWLTSQAVETWGAEQAAGLTADIAAMATAMVQLSNIKLEDSMEPLFP